MDRAFGFGLIPPTRMVRLDLDDMKAALRDSFAARGESASRSGKLDEQLKMIEHWRDNAKPNLKSRWSRTNVREPCIASVCLEIYAYVYGRVMLDC